MGTDDEVQIMPFQKGRHNVGTKHKGYPSIVLRPSIDTGVGITPQKVAHQTDVGDVTRPLEVGNLAERLHLRAEPTMHAQDLLVDEIGGHLASELDVEPILQPAHLGPVDGVVAQQRGLNCLIA